MKRLSSLILFVCMMVGITSCKDGAPIFVNSTGAPYDLVLVMDQAQWKSPIGDEVFNVFNADVPGLPQSEPLFKINYTPPKHFDRIMKLVRNIVLVEINPERYSQGKVSFSRDLWAKNQLIVKIQAPDDAAMKALLDEKKQYIVDLFVNNELKRVEAILKDGYSKAAYDTVMDVFGVEFRVPQELNKMKRGENFIWFSNDAGSGRRDLLIYSFPFTAPKTFTQEYLIAKRDSVVKVNIPGGPEGSYMVTETLIPPVMKDLNFRGDYAAELRGLWKMKNDVMGGPFVCIARLDKSTNQVIVVEGFVYAPEKKKRNFVRQLEGALHTLKFKSDKETVEAQPVPISDEVEN